MDALSHIYVPLVTVHWPVNHLVTVTVCNILHIYFHVISYFIGEKINSHGSLDQGTNLSPKRNGLWVIFAIRVCTDTHFKNLLEI